MGTIFSQVPMQLQEFILDFFVIATFMVQEDCTLRETDEFCSCVR